MSEEKNKHEATLYNPFHVDGLNKKPIIKKGMVVERVNPDTGEVETYTKTPKSEFVDHDTWSYTKVFHVAWDIVKELSPAGISLFMYMVAHQTKVGWDTTFLNPADVCQECKFSRSSFRRAVEEMLTRKIIAKKLGSYLEYWINPNVFFNGNRVGLADRYHQHIEIDGNKQPGRAEGSPKEK